MIYLIWAAYETPEIYLPSIQDRRRFEQSRIIFLLSRVPCMNVDVCLRWSYELPLEKIRELILMMNFYLCWVIYMKV